MKDIIQIGKVAFVKVPEDATDFKLSLLCHNLIFNTIELDRYYQYTYNKRQEVQLPQGDWQLLGRAIELTDEQKELCVESKVWQRSLGGGEFTTYLDYGYLKEHNEYLHDIFEVSKSYTSLIESNNITNNYVVILNKTA